MFGLWKQLLRLSSKLPDLITVRDTSIEYMRVTYTQYWLAEAEASHSNFV